MLTLKHTIFSKDSSHLEQVRDTLFELSSNVNADFNGDNGEEYLEEVAKENGYENNLDYYFDYYAKFYDVKPIYNDVNCCGDYHLLITRVVEEMVRGCYKGNWDFIINENEFIISIYIEWY